VLNRKLKEVNREGKRARNKHELVKQIFLRPSFLEKSTLILFLTDQAAVEL